MKIKTRTLLRPFGLFTLPGVLDALLFWSIFACSSTLMLWLLTSTIKTILRETVFGGLYAQTVSVGELVASDLGADPANKGRGGDGSSLKLLEKHLTRIVNRDSQLLGVAVLETSDKGARILVASQDSVKSRLPLDEERFRDWVAIAATSDSPFFSDWLFLHKTALPLFTPVVTEPEYSFHFIPGAGEDRGGKMVVVLVFNAPEIQEKFLRVDRIAATVIAMAIILSTLLSLFVRRRSVQRQEAIGEKLAVLGLLGQRDAILAGVAAAADDIVRDKNIEPAVAGLMRRIREVLDVRDAFTCLSPQFNRPGPTEEKLAVLGARAAEPTLDWSDLDRSELSGWRGRFLSLQPVTGPLEQLSTSERACLREKGIPNLAAVPILFESNLVGFIALVEGDEQRSWEPGLLDTLRLAADLIGAAFARREQDRLLIETGKMQALGRMAAGVAHEFNNLLHIISGNLRIFSGRGQTPSVDRELVDKIIEATERGGRIVEQLLSATRQGTPDLRRASLNEVVQKTVFLAQSALRKDVRLILTLDPKLPPVMMDSAQIQQVILNLLINAQDAIGGDGKIIIATGSTMQRLNEGVSRHVFCVVQDSGSGIAEKDIEHLFDPFFTTKPPGKGTGLGLSTSRGILEQHRGAILARNIEPHGASFTFYLPAADDKEPVPLDPALASGTAPLRLEPALVLVADDEPMCRDVLRVTLGEAGMRCLEASDGGEAVRLAQEQGGSIGWVVTDWSMPGLHGRELVIELRRLLPGVPILITSGFVLEAEEIPGIDGVVMKPFSPETLLRKMAEISEQGRLREGKG
ncbi:MAG: ATP-binding protein [Candidatus Methylacidiphilales bacterium]|nr:ATP-binding protein [Candidatus Methylacidiphilales bacterium]